MDLSVVDKETPLLLVNVIPDELILIGFDCGAVIDASPVFIQLEAEDDPLPPLIKNNSSIVIVAKPLGLS